jgi:type IX secretion system PorP/SprF family membrane protein
MKTHSGIKLTGMKISDNFRILLAAILLFLVTGTIQAQDPIFTQFYNNPIYYNPGYIGLNPGFRARFNFRDQWTGLPADFRTSTFSLDVAERNLPGSGGLGMLVMNDRAGTGLLNTNFVGIGTAARVPLQQNMVVQLGMMVSFVQKTINWEDLVFSDQLNPRLGIYKSSAFRQPDRNNVSYPDFSVGGVYRFNERTSSIPSIQGTFGIALHHVFKPNESFLGLSSPLPSRLTVTGDMIFEVAEGRSSYRGRFKNQGAFRLNPSFIWEKQTEFQTYSMGLNVLKSSVYLGAWYRNQLLNNFKANDLMFVVGFNAPFNADSRIKVMYSYDYIITNLRTAARNSHEVTLILEFDQFNIFGKKRNLPSFRGRNYREMDCTPF